MREIKFRAWDKEEKTMIDADSWYFSDEFELFIDSVKRCMERFILMQFTGLCDKKEKEGYHKDIWLMGSEEYGKSSARCVIEWDKGAFYLQPIGTDQRWSIQLLPDGEIIGNVFQNED